MVLSKSGLLLQRVVVQRPSFEKHESLFQNTLCYVTLSDLR